MRRAPLQGRRSHVGVAALHGRVHGPGGSARVLRTFARHAHRRRARSPTRDRPPALEVWTAAGRAHLAPAQARAATPYARCVTQAVCAPALEWFAHAGVHARELARPHPLRVDILSCGSVSARKRLMLSVGVVEVSVFVTERLVVVSSNPTPRGRRRTSPGGDDGGRRAGARRRPRTASPQRLAPVAKAHDESSATRA